MNEIEAPNDQRAGMSSAGVTINLRKLEELLTPNPLVEIAMLINRLTYGEMIELAEAMWKTHTEGLAITEDNLPALLHRWCKSHLAVAEGGAQESFSLKGGLEPPSIASWEKVRKKRRPQAGALQMPRHPICPANAVVSAMCRNDVFRVAPAQSAKASAKTRAQSGGERRSRSEPPTFIEPSPASRRPESHGCTGMRSVPRAEHNDAAVPGCTERCVRHPHLRA